MSKKTLQEIIDQTVAMSALCAYARVIDASKNESSDAPQRSLVYEQKDELVEVYVTAEGWVVDITKHSLQEAVAKDVDGTGSVEDPFTFKLEIQHKVQSDASANSEKNPDPMRKDRDDSRDESIDGRS